MGLGEGGGGAGGGDDERDGLRLNAALGASQLAGDELVHPGEAVFGGGVGGDEFLGEADCAEGKTDGFADAFVFAEGDFATAAT